MQHPSSALLSCLQGLSAAASLRRAAAARRSSPQFRESMEFAKVDVDENEEARRATYPPGACLTRTVSHKKLDDSWLNLSA